MERVLILLLMPQLRYSAPEVAPKEIVPLEFKDAAAASGDPNSCHLPPCSSRRLSSKGSRRLSSKDNSKDNNKDSSRDNSREHNKGP